jgi:hypothetical protein
VALFTAGQNVIVMQAEGMQHAWIRLFFALLLSWLPWAVATPLVLRWGRLYSPSGWRPFSTWLRHLAAWVVISLSAAAWWAWLDVSLNPLALSAGPGPFVPLWRNTFYDGIAQSLFLYAALFAVSRIIEFRERLVQGQIEKSRLNEQLSKAQLDALRHQIEPHFLFNSLNSVAGLVREKKNDDAVNMIVGLSDFLRKVVEDSDRQHVPLGEEMEFLQTYLEIQKFRFSDRLDVCVNVPKELYAAQVPSFILQPMVENALKHGVSKLVKGGTIRIAAVRSNGVLTLSVYNDGPQLPAGWEARHSGIGILNSRTRLRCLYGDDFSFELRNQAPGGVEVSVSVPFREV